jgi:hypothetical protein
LHGAMVHAQHHSSQPRPAHRRLDDQMVRRGVLLDPLGRGAFR